jgi:hypothetical protein
MAQARSSSGWVALAQLAAETVPQCPCCCRSFVSLHIPSQSTAVRGFAPRSLRQKSEIRSRKRYPFTSSRQRFLLYDLQKPTLAKLKGKHQLFRGLVCSAEFFTNRFSSEREGAVSPTKAVGRKP